MPKQGTGGKRPFSEMRRRWWRLLGGASTSRQLAIVGEGAGGWRPWHREIHGADRGSGYRSQGMDGCQAAAPFVSRPPCPKAQTPCDARPLMLPEERVSARIRPHESEVEKEEHSGCGWGEKSVRRLCRRVAVQERRKKMRTRGCLVDWTMNRFLLTYVIRGCVMRGRN